MQAAAAKQCSISALRRRDNVGIDKEEDEAQSLASHPPNAHLLNENAHNPQHRGESRSSQQLTPQNLAREDPSARDVNVN